MNLQETQKILMTIDSMFPNWKPKSLVITTKLWAEVMKDYDYKDIEESLMTYFRTDTNGFAPVPAQLIVPAQKKREARELEELLRIPESEIFKLRVDELNHLEEKE